jgi:hypothetical protein
MAEIIARNGNELTIQVTIKLKGGIHINAVISMNLIFAFKISSKYKQLANTRGRISIVAQK